MQEYKNRQQKNRPLFHRIFTPLAIVLSLLLVSVLLVTCNLREMQQFSSAAPSLSEENPFLTPRSTGATSEGTGGTQASSPPAPQSAPIPSFAEGTPTVEISNGAANVTFKTNAPADVYCVLVLGQEQPTTTQFFDYYNLGLPYAPAVYKRTVEGVTSEGKTETFEIPDSTQRYSLLVNVAAPNNGAWQPTIMVVPLYSAGDDNAASA